MIFLVFDAEEGIYYEHVKGFQIQQTPRLHARGGDAPNSRIVKLNIMDRWFFIKLMEIENLISEETKVNLHGGGKNGVTKARVNGKAFLVDRLVSVERATFETMDNTTDFVNLGPREGVKVNEDDIGRFFINDSGDIINGSFEFEGQLIRVQNNEHPIMMEAKQRMSKATVPPVPLMISVQGTDSTISMPRNPLSKRPYKCGHDLLKFNSQQKNDQFPDMKLMSKMHSNILDGTKQLFPRMQNGCPALNKVLYIGVVADCNYMDAFNGNAAQAQANILNDFNMVSSIYEEAFNIQLGIISIDLHMDCSSKSSSKPWNVPCSRKMLMDERLNLFTKWRSTQTADAGVFHLVSGCPSSDVVGIAWLGQVCQPRPYTDPNGDTVAGTSVSVFIKNQFAIIAHEIGHNLGAIHDCDKEACKECQGGGNCKCCPCGNRCDCKSQFVMNPESGGLNVKKFSLCSQEDICTKFPIIGHCLKEPGSMKTITSAMCGDGIRDEGEECDCGGPEKCRGHPCCTEDCKLKKGAVCSDDNDRCCRHCKLIPEKEKHVCIPSKGLCQRESICNGKSRDCPRVYFAEDGSSCENPNGQCASGICTSRDLQCVAIGARMGLKKSCPFDHSCDLVCQSENGCVKMDATFINGTPCGYKGRCYDGKCSEPAYKTFVMKNILPIGLFVGSILFFILYIASKEIIRVCRRHRHQNQGITFNSNNQY